MRTLRMMVWLGRGFWRNFRQLRDSVAMRMMGKWLRVDGEDGSGEGNLRVWGVVG
jgi:hypothetical protein